MTDPSPTAAAAPDPGDVAGGGSVAGAPALHPAGAAPVAAGAGGGAARAAGAAAPAVARRARPARAPVVGAALPSPGLPGRLQPGRGLSVLGGRRGVARVAAGIELAD